MSVLRLSYEAKAPASGYCLAPAGMATPYGTSTLIEDAAGEWRTLTEAGTGQQARLIPLKGGKITLAYAVDTAARAPYPEVIFSPRPSRYTRFADELAAEAGNIAPNAQGLERITAIACATAQRFIYAHPDARFNDGTDAVPAIGCGMTEGSCVDINTYFTASLRAAGFEAGYVTGYFFPEEKQGHCEDGHCWVVTRFDGQTHEWDIAHHIKIDTRDICPALNPKPGQRVACFHSMGHAFPQIGVTDMKALIEPVFVLGDQIVRTDAPEISLAPQTVSVA